MKRFHNTPDKRALSVTVLRAVCSPDVRAEAPTELREKTDRRRPAFVQEPPSRSSLWADHKRRRNSHSVRRLNCSLGRLGVLATAGHQPGSAEVLLCQRMKLAAQQRRNPGSEARRSGPNPACRKLLQWTACDRYWQRRFILSLWFLIFCRSCSQGVLSASTG